MSACGGAPAPAPTEKPPTPQAKENPQPETAPVAAPKPKPASPAEQAEALVSTMESLGKEHAAHADDCPALAVALEGFTVDHRAQLDAQTPKLHALIDADDGLRSRLRTAMGTVMTASMRCRDDAAVTAVYAKLKAR